MSSILRTGALTTYSAAKAELAALSSAAIVDATDQPLIERIINAVSDAVEAYCGRAFAQASITETLAPPRGVRLRVKQTPIAATPAPVIVLDGSTIAATDYEIEDAEAGYIHRDNGWSAEDYEDSIAGSVTQATKPGTAERVLDVTYTGGYVMPAEGDPLNDSSIAVTHVGTGTGTVAASGSVVAAHAVVGTVGGTGTTLTLAISGGATAAVAILPGSALDVGKSYPTLAALDGLVLTFSATGTWVDGDTHSFATPGVAVHARTLPWDLEQAVISAVAWCWRVRQSGYETGSAGNDKNTAIGRGLAGMLPDYVLPTLDRYRASVL